MEKEMAPAAVDIAGEKKQQRSGGKVFQRFLKNRLSVLGAVIVLFAFGGAILAPLFSPYDPNILNTQRRLSPRGPRGISWEPMNSAGTWSAAFCGEPGSPFLFRLPPP